MTGQLLIVVLQLYSRHFEQTCIPTHWHHHVVLVLLLALDGQVRGQLQACVVGASGPVLPQSRGETGTPGTVTFI